MEVLLALVGADVADRTLSTADRVRAVNLDAVQGDQETAAEALERLQGALLAHRVEAQREELAEGLRREAFQQIPNLVVAGVVLHAEQGLTIGVGVFLLHAALEAQEGGGLHEKYREGAGDGVAGVASLTRIG